jgi:hypothetical protein
MPFLGSTGGLEPIPVIEDHGVKGVPSGPETGPTYRQLRQPPLARGGLLNL